MIHQLYYETAAKIGFINPPPLLLKTLPIGVVAQEIRLWSGKDRHCKDIHYRIEIDPDKLFNTDMPAEFVIVHELSHTASHRVVGGGGKTLDNQNHGSAFLAGFLVNLRKLGIGETEIKAFALWHGHYYRLPSQHVELAINCAKKTNNVHTAMTEAVIHPPTPRREKIILATTGVIFLSYIITCFYHLI